MDLEQVKTFLAVAAHGSFIEAADRLFVTQSTVSSRIQNLERQLGRKLFQRNRSGASLTPAGRRFMKHAQSLMLTLNQARHDVGLPDRYTSSLAVGGRIALWEEFLPEFIGCLRERLPDVSCRTEIGFEDDLMRNLIEGNLDVGLMYTPSHSPGLVVEHLFDEELVLLATEPDRAWPDENYVYVGWGPGFDQLHAGAFPDLERPAQSANIGWLALQLLFTNGGSCYLPLRMARPMLAQKRLFRIPEAPVFRLPAYMVYPQRSDSDVVGQATDLLREMAMQLRA